MDEDSSSKEGNKKGRCKTNKVLIIFIMVNLLSEKILAPMPCIGAFL